MLLFLNHTHTLTDTGEYSKLVHTRKRPKVDTLFSSLFFPTRPSDEYDTALSRKYSRPLLNTGPNLGHNPHQNPHPTHTLILTVNLEKMSVKIC